MLARSLPALLLGALCSAQSPTPIEGLSRVFRPRPDVPRALDTDAVTGRFIDGHPGRSIVTVLDGDPVLTFQPFQFLHAHTTAFGNVERIATLPAPNASSDRLLVSRAQGLQVMGYGPTGFVAVAGSSPMQQSSAVMLPNGPQPVVTSSVGWSGLEDLRVTEASQTGTYLVLGRRSSGVQIVTVQWDGTTSASVTLPVPAGASILDAAFVDWLPGGEPEIGVLTTDGLLIQGANGVQLLSIPGPFQAGRIAARGGDGAAQIVAVVEEGPAWRVWTVSPGGSRPILFDGGTVTLDSAPIGLASVDLVSDAHAELVVSTAASLRTILLGQAEGVVSDAMTNLVFSDLGPESATMSAIPNLVPAVFDDLDRDGATDVAILHADTHQLILLNDLGGQLEPPTAFLGGDQQGFELVASLGVETQSNFASTPVGWSQPMSDVDMLAVRLQLPEVLPTDLFRVVVYTIGEGGQPVTSESGTDLRAWNVFWFVAADASPAGLLDLMIPVPAAQELMQGQLVGRLTLEISMVTPGEQMGFAAPLLLEYAVQSGVTWQGLMTVISSFAQFILPVDSTIFDPFSWFAGSTPEGDPIPDTRYFGAIITVKSQEALTNPPTMPPPLVLNTGVGH